MFEQSVFIRKNTPELVNKLKQIGYRFSHIGNEKINDSIATTANTSNFSFINQNQYDDNFPHTSWNINGKRIDCGTNEDLFLALAALTIYSPNFQWFVWNDKEDKGDLWKQYMPGENWEEWWNFETHKATVKEIIEHFK